MVPPRGLLEIKVFLKPRSVRLNREAAAEGKSLLPGRRGILTGSFPKGVRGMKSGSGNSAKRAIRPNRSAGMIRIFLRRVPRKNVRLTRRRNFFRNGKTADS